jgi:hypothetical protein
MIPDLFVTNAALAGGYHLKIRLTKSAHGQFQADRIPLRIGRPHESRFKALAPAGVLCVRGESGLHLPSIAPPSVGAYFVRTEGARRPTQWLAEQPMLHRR